MPEFILPEEADKCIHCGKTLFYPPNCCDKAQQEHLDSIYSVEDEGFLDDGYPIYVDNDDYYVAFNDYDYYCEFCENMPCTCELGVPG